MLGGHGEDYKHHNTLDTDIWTGDQLLEAYDCIDKYQDSN